MRAFLIDFENVKSAGLVGIDTLGIDDQVVILYSVNSNTISFEMHQKIMSCAANVEYYQIRRGGKNSLDFQLSTMLGYLLASGLYTHLYIVSNDSGFDALYDFWTSGYLPTDCVVYRRPNIAMSVAHSVFTGKQIARDVSSNVEEVDVTVTDSAAYEQFEMERDDHSRTEDEKQQDIVEIVAEQLPETSSDEQSGEESAAEVDDFETAALLGALQAVQQQETENELKKGWEESDDISAAARMRQAELDAEEEESYLLLTTVQGEKVRAAQKEIMYMEAFAHTVQIHTKEEILEVRCGINTLEEQLEGKNFIRCHRSYIVGLAYAARIKKKELLLDDGTSVPVSRRLFQEVNRAFVAYYRREESGEYGTGERT